MQKARKVIFMWKMKSLKRLTGVLLAGLISAGASISGAAVTGVTTEVTAYAANAVAVNAASFPDGNFRGYVSQNIDTDRDGKLNVSEIAACTEIDCSRRIISSLKGIEHFTELTELDCGRNKLNSLDVSKNTKLTYLVCSSNDLSSLDISKNTKLTYLDCQANSLSRLDVSKNTALSVLMCGANKLSSLNVGKNTALWCLNCYGNGLSTLDLSKNTKLKHLYCMVNKLSSLDLSRNTALKTLACYDNNLGSLDVSRNTKLSHVTAGHQEKDVTVTNGKILLSSLSPKIAASNIKNLKGATLSGNKLINIKGKTITYDYKTGYKNETMDVTLNVNYEAAPEKVTLDKKYLVLSKGKTGNLTAAVTPADSNDKVTWSSSDTNVATVDAAGNVKAISPGTAKITVVTTNGKTAECEVRVNFTDVTNPKSWYYKAVYWAEENGITTGIGGKFSQADNCTREQAITFLWRMAGKPNPKSMTSKFSDVKDSKRYSYKAIMWGTENGIITGSNGMFRPANTCTREQIVTMLWRHAGKPSPKKMTSRFRDVTNKNRYSYKAIMWAQENGITTGSNGLFSPAGLCKRGETVTFIYRYSKNIYKPANDNPDAGSTVVYKPSYELSPEAEKLYSWMVTNIKNPPGDTAEYGKVDYLVYDEAHTAVEKDYYKYSSGPFGVWSLLNGLTLQAALSNEYLLNAIFIQENVQAIEEDIFYEGISQKDALHAIDELFRYKYRYIDEVYTLHDAFTYKDATFYGGGTCATYAMLTCALCGDLGIECYYVRGTADNGIERDSHAWNKVKINDKWYYVDFTWNDFGLYYLTETLWDDHNIEEMFPLYV